ncbi:unannotated protein [freshwater metagenome]|uniref:Unannotated protein n=1 Tax=freshwater metagenome TaxID=449393 RepID=A0A6J6YJH7_9ZZZZ
MFGSQLLSATAWRRVQEAREERLWVLPNKYGERILE